MKVGANLEEANILGIGKFYSLNIYTILYSSFVYDILISCAYERIGNNGVELISRLGIMNAVTNVRDEFDKLWGTTNVMTSIMYI